MLLCKSIWIHVNGCALNIVGLSVVSRKFPISLNIILCRNVVAHVTDDKMSDRQMTPPPTQDATTATSYIIDNFGMRDLFGRENYEYYARLTGRILKVTLNCEMPVLQLWQNSGGGRVDFLHLPFGLPRHTQRPWPRFEEPKVWRNNFSSVPKKFVDK